MEIKGVKSFIKIGDNKVHKICRLCGIKSINCIPIFEENNYCIPEKISRCLPIIILPTDDLPSDLCRSCLSHLNTSYKLILTSLETDNRLRAELNQSRKSISKDGAISCEESEISKSTNAKPLTLTELKQQAITGPAGCDVCDLKFQDVNLFDKHMEQSHLLKWRCNLCDSSFYQSSELITHKMLKHSGNITTCDNCKQPNNQNDKCKLINKKNIHKVQDKQQKITGENNVFKRAVATSTINEETATSSINIASQADDIIVISDSSSEQMDLGDQIDLTDQSDYTSDSETDRFIKNWDIILKKLIMLKEKEKERLFCNVCKIYFGDDRFFNAHNRIHEEKSVTCTACSVECSSLYDLFLHKRAMHNKYKKTLVKYVCSKCNKYFIYNWNWEKHEKECSKIANHHCKYCDTTFMSRPELSHHLKAMHRQNHFERKCNYCDIVFYKRQSLIKHMQESHASEPNMLETLATINKPDEMSHICRYCGKMLGSYQTLIEHERIHTGEKPFKCSVCNRSFRSCTLRWLHKQSHIKGNFVCEQCGKSFSRKQYLNTHRQIHLPMEARKHQCHLCGKRFVRSSYLTIHKQIHQGIRPYKCDICSLSFTQPGDMKRHRMRHFNKTQDKRRKIIQAEKQA